MATLNIEELNFDKTSIIDPVGRVFYHQDRVFRIITDKKIASLYHTLLTNSNSSNLFKKGLVKTWIANDIDIQGTELVLEHQKLSLAIHPAELTITSINQSVDMLIDLQKYLLSQNIQLKDCHPWNLMAEKGKLHYIDFGSLVPYLGKFITQWYEELKKFYLIPLWLHKNHGEKISQEYRREHLKGFGQLYVTKNLIAECKFPPSISIDSTEKDIQKLLESIFEWKSNLKIQVEPQKWANYQQSGDQSNALTPITDKHKFVYEWLNNLKPQKVLDMAGNKGFYSEVAARLGSAVISFDNEELNVDTCNINATKNDLNITAVLMDFLHPTPASGIGLSFPDAYTRFSADTVLVLGLIHHICLGYGIPLQSFLNSVLRYNPENIIIEYVFEDDIHLKTWKRPFPSDYSFENLKKLLHRDSFNLIDELMIINEGVHRCMLTFTR